MSIETWKKEFYPVPASKCSKKGALAHSLRKWLGQRAAALRRHRVEVDDEGWGYKIKDDDSLRFYISEDSCALCWRWLKTCGCRKCPLYKIHKRRCYESLAGRISPWNHWTIHSNPEPMIRLIRKAMKGKK